MTFGNGKGGWSTVGFRQLMGYDWIGQRVGIGWATVTTRTTFGVYN